MSELTRTPRRMTLQLLVDLRGAYRNDLQITTCHVMCPANWRFHAYHNEPNTAGGTINLTVENP